MTKPKSQSQKFKDLARESGCDEDEAAFDKRLKRIAESQDERKDKTNKEVGSLPE